MQTNDQTAPDPLNQDAYEDLLTAIELSQDQLSLLIAVCDDPTLRQEIIQRYEAELTPTHQIYRLNIAQGEPSIKTAIRQLVESEAALQPGSRAVITISGIEQLAFLSWNDLPSQQDQFFGYLQWTREALREFRFPIVIWLTYQTLKQLSRKSPDFWSWRKGVFRFASRTKAAIPARELAAIQQMGLAEIDEETLLPLVDFQALIQDLEQRNPKDPLLSSLYFQMGRVYQNRLDAGEAANYATEQEQAIAYFEKAIALQQKLKQELDLADSLNNLAGLYESQGRYSEAEPLYLQALHIYQQQLGQEHPNTAASLNNLALLYYWQERYSEAEPLYLQALHISQQHLGQEHPDTATGLNNLALLYDSQERYSEAEPLYLQALRISESQLGADHPSTATSLNNLAELYKSQGRYSEAEPLYLQALHIRQQQLGQEHPDTATSLNNLAGLYYQMQRFDQAELLMAQALETRQRLLGDQHPYTIGSRKRLEMIRAAKEQGKPGS